MGTETAVAPTLTVKVVFANLQFIILLFPHSLPFLSSYVISLLSLKIYLYASSISHSYRPSLMFNIRKRGAGNEIWEAM